MKGTAALGLEEHFPGQGLVVVPPPCDVLLTHGACRRERGVYFLWEQRMCVGIMSADACTGDRGGCRPSSKPTLFPPLVTHRLLADAPAGTAG